MITLKTIKNLIETTLDYEDISCRKRNFYSSHARFVYFEIAKNYTKYSLHEIGKEVNRKHSTVLHGLKLFKNEYSTDEFTYNLYNNVIKRISSFFENVIPEEDILNIQEVKKIHEHYKIKHIVLTEKSHEVINNLISENIRLKNMFSVIDKNLYNEISELSHDELLELQARIKIFLKVTKQLKLNRHEGKKSMATSALVSH